MVQINKEELQLVVNALLTEVMLTEEKYVSEELDFSNVTEEQHKEREELLTKLSNILY